MATQTIKIGPADHGRRMTLDDFDRAEIQEGLLYELGRGVIIVSDVPGRRHLMQLNAIRRQLHAYDFQHPGRIHTIGSGSDCKILIADLESERHPDVAIYKNPPPQEEDFWGLWIPEIVIEVVSPSSEERDYVEKREEYLRFGVREYWIVDAQRQEILVLRRWRGRWTERVLHASDTYSSCLLPDFVFVCAAVLEAGNP
jgi:Uma2 family endonuclease